MRALILLGVGWLAAGCGGSPPGGPDAADDGPGDGAPDACGPCDGALVDAAFDSPIDGPTIAPCPSGQWCIETAPIAAGTRLHGAWAAGANDVFAVGTTGTIVHRHDGSWSAMQSGSTETLHGIWGTSASNVWAVGSNGTLLHFTGAAWTPTTGVSAADLYAVWGSSATDIWVAGSGVVLHGNGTTWTTTNLAGILMAVSGTGPNDVWVTGESSSVRHYTGSPTWANVNPGNGQTYFGILALSATNVWATSAVPTKEWMNYTGSGWTAHATSSVIFQALHAVSATDVWGVASRKIGNWNGSAWTVQQPSVITAPLWGVTGAAGNVWVVGDNATIAHRAP